MTRIDVGEVVPGRRPRDATDARVHLALRELPLAHRGRVVLRDDPEPLVDEGLLAVDQDHGDPGVGEGHRDSSAHRAGAEDGHLAHGERRRVGGDIGDLRRRSLGEEHVTQGLRLPRLHRLPEELALALETLLEGEIDGGLHRVHAAKRRLPAASPRGRVFPRLREDRRVALRLLEVGGEIASARHGAGGCHSLREGDRGVHEVSALDDLVDETERLGLGGSDRLAADDHLQGLGYADQPGQPLRAARSGEEAQLDLGQTALRVARGDPVVAPERHFEPAAEGRAVERGDDGLGAPFVAGDDRVEPGILRGFAELRDVRARDERAPGARDDDRLHVRVGERALEGRDQPFAHGVAERVDRRIVHHDEAHRASLLPTDDIAHGLGLSLRPTLPRSRASRLSTKRQFIELSRRPPGGRRGLEPPRVRTPSPPRLARAIRARSSRRSGARRRGDG